MFEFRAVPANLKTTLEKLFSDTPHVDLSIPSVLEGQQGACIAIKVDHMTRPTAAQIEQGSFAVFAGTPDKATAVEFIKKLKKTCAIQPSPGKWINWIKEAYPNNTQTYKRYSFTSSSLREENLISLINDHPYNGRIKNINLEAATQLSTDDWGKYHFLNYEDPAHFIEKGMGYFIQEGDVIAAACTSALVCSKGIELNIITHPDFRNKGLATIAAARLILDCLNKGMEPHWDAANDISRNLALKLGYTEKGMYDVVVYK